MKREGKKGQHRKAVKQERKSAPTQHHLLLFSTAETHQRPRRERGRQRRRRIRRWFNSSVQLQRQLLPPSASLIKYLASESARERNGKDLCSFYTKRLEQFCSAGLLVKVVSLLFCFLYFVETETMPQVCCARVSVCVCMRGGNAVGVSMELYCCENVRSISSG